MERREMFGALGALALAGLAADGQAADAPAADHSHHDHGGSSKYQALISAANECVAKGDACLAHCLVLLGNGDKGMASCAKSVNQLVAMCTALRTVAAQGSKHTVALAKLTLKACTECEKECKKHEDKHAECKACRESCTECIEQCKAV